RNWERFYPRPLGAFTQEAYAILQAHQSIMPPAIQRRLGLMIQDDWLLRYGTVDGMEFTFERMKLRVSRPEWLERPFDSLLEQIDAFEEEFLQFFPEVIEYVQTHCKC
ncbi:MAG: acyl carrier protein phosphodiesterase, partial [Phaeodactylibacter sp.]|nr:acyl carrier protein phosphodiesterase [Phaeodactylibacter sp.]